ncbi:7-carboxy-7-deazaguanine synthase QueE [Mucilaginibacter aquatilis]|uniref:7-carboxy-7-deazaguanine synthase n=1 Tax=Mucilaginibacter aquatilis TaxID=1517760 RepID=A0A6I4IR05_9SPHI|nr:7-carboxy-7-deazaguanine synthase QueE [Mucilaginibacter aquatilis]MVN91964.1 4Fe-4S cluster-binding domain-containing protein [Mucilaginibacter aquatilis]
MLKLAKLNNRPEIFHSIQGEGKNLGKPSVFIRLSLCNLYCKWCDTDYTWNWEGTSYAHNNDALPGYHKFAKDEMMALLSDDEINAIVTDYNCKNLVITGGEPLVQQKSLISLLQLLRQTNPLYHIEYETNGTFIPLPEVDALSDQYNVSVKLSNSGVEYNERVVPEAISWFATSPKSNFKFVVDTNDDLNEVQQIITDHKISNEAVFLMPQGSSVESLQQKQNWIVELCKQYNYNYSDRLHIHIWGAKRGI